MVKCHDGDGGKQQDTVALINTVNKFNRSN